MLIYVQATGFHRHLFFLGTNKWMRQVLLQKLTLQRNRVVRQKKSLHPLSPENQTNSCLTYREQIWCRRSPCLEGIWESESLRAYLGCQASSGSCLGGHVGLYYHGRNRPTSRINNTDLGGKEVWTGLKTSIIECNCFIFLGLDSKKDVTSCVDFLSFPFLVSLTVHNFLILNHPEFSFTLSFPEVIHQQCSVT